MEWKYIDSPEQKKVPGAAFSKLTIEFLEKVAGRIL